MEFRLLQLTLCLIWAQVLLSCRTNSIRSFTKLAQHPGPTTTQDQLRRLLSDLTASSGASRVHGIASGHKRPRIYIYPRNITEPFLKQNGHGPGGRHGMYGIDFLFAELLHASPYVTKDPEEADYFFFECLTYFGTNSDIPAMIKVMQKFGPWFDRKKGADHIWVIPDDFGGCAYQWHLPRKAIVIHHFGRVYDALEPNPCKLFDEWGDECETHIRMVQNRQNSQPWPRPPCHIPYQYIVVPPTYLYERGYMDGYLRVDPRYGPLNATNRFNRNTFFFFAGPINLHVNNKEHAEHPESDAMYSFGARQTVARMYRNDPRFRLIETHVVNYTAEIMNAQFCLGPAGWGWGGRVKAAVLHGCIPVIIQPNIKVEWEEQLPMQDYALRMPLYMVHELPEILELLVNTGKAEKMRQAMQCTWRFHWWLPTVGRALDLVMCELKARLHNKRVKLDTSTCMLDCGDGQLIDVYNSKPYMV